MLTTSANPQIAPSHLERNAYVYIRQSTLQQVLRNKESTERQYALAQRACELGWSKEQVLVVDDDLGCSGKTAQGRIGFQRLVSEVGLGRAGAVIGIEVSRLARSCSDWHRLIELCTLGDSLIIDEDGIYDPRHFNDRLLLGLKGTMSEAELHFLRSRLWGGKLNKAQKGELVFCLPVGLAYSPTLDIILNPNQQIQHAFFTLFRKFDELESAWKVVAYFRDHKLLFPSRQHSGVMDSETLWVPLSHGRVLGALHNPLYAGAYAFGRRTERHAPLGPKSTLVPMEKWHVLIKDHFAGYISWEQFLRHQQMLRNNQTNYAALNLRGVARAGAALLQGIVLCGRCGRRMTIRYKDNGRQCLVYLCEASRRFFTGNTCQAVKGWLVDEAVGQAFLKAVQPTRLKVALKAFEKIEENRKLLLRQWELQIEKARFEAERAARQFQAVEPENRLVARTLESQWNAKLAVLEKLQQDFQAEMNKAPLTLNAAQRDQITALAQDLPAIWQAPSTSHDDKKRLVRVLIQDVTLTRQKETSTVRMQIHWKTGATSEIVREHPRPYQQDVQTSTTVVDFVREKAATLPDRDIAQELNHLRLTSGHGRKFHEGMIKWIRYRYKIVSACPSGPTRQFPLVRGDGRCSAQAIAKELGISINQVHYLRHKGLLRATQAMPRSPWWFEVTAGELDRIRKMLHNPGRNRFPNTV